MSDTPSIGPREEDRVRSLPEQEQRRIRAARDEFADDIINFAKERVPAILRQHKVDENVDPFAIIAMSLSVALSNTIVLYYASGYEEDGLRSAAQDIASAIKSFNNPSPALARFLAKKAKLDAESAGGVQ